MREIYKPTEYFQDALPIDVYIQEEFPIELYPNRVQAEVDTTSEIEDIRSQKLGKMAIFDYLASLA